MATMFFQEDDFVVTFDPTQVVEVRSWEYSYYLGFKGGGSTTVPKKHEALCNLILGLVKDNFELPTPEALSKQISYRLEGFVATRFVLSFPNLDDHIEALSLIKDHLLTKFRVEIPIQENVKNLTFAVNFPAYYSFYKDNKALIISILGEPVKD